MRRLIGRGIFTVEISTAGGISDRHLGKRYDRDAVAGTYRFAYDGVDISDLADL